MEKRQPVRRAYSAAPFPFELYSPEGAGPHPPHPLICITPILGRLIFLEDLFFERRFARYFASRGFAAAVIRRPIFEFDPGAGIGQIRHYLEESILRNRKVLDFLLTKEDIDASRAASFGISFGAVVSCLWAAEDPRLKAHVFALGGGNLPGIFLTSRDPLMKSYFKAAEAHCREKGKNLPAELKRSFPVDPLDGGASIPAEKVLMILGLFDRVVRFQYGMSLREALGRPKTIFLPLGHYTSLLAVPFLKPAIVKFYREVLGV